MALEQAWIDVAAPPVAPAAAGLGWPLTLIVAGVVLGLWWHRRRGANWRARSGLRRMGRHLARGLAPDTAAARHFARAIRQQLRQGLGHADLHAVRWPTAAHRDWQAYLERLARAGFAPAAPSRAELAALLDEARAWLARARGETS